MHTVFTTTFGSHLYGTNTPASDMDIKSVFIPDGRDILLQRVKDTISNHRPKREGEKNVAGDLDEEAYAFHKFINLLSQGQTVALDILFATGTPHMKISDNQHFAFAWEKLYNNRSRVITRNSASFVGYCQKQANKYGIKGSRVHAVRTVVECLEGIMAFQPANTKLWEVDLSIKIMVHDLQHTAIVPIEQASRPEPILHLECCGRKVPFTNTIKQAYEVYKRLFDEYGARALLAEQNESVDWKALSHAVRVGHEAIELLETHKITFPLPNREHILDIKLGKLQYKDVAEEIEQLLVNVEQATLTSTLPDEPDRELMDRIVCEAYRSVL